MPFLIVSALYVTTIGTSSVDLGVSSLLVSKPKEGAYEPILRPGR